MATKFNPPSNWPQPPAGWSPPQHWQPDPAWGPAPPGWQFWVEVEDSPSQPAEQDDDALPHIFISYRRSDCQSQANGVHDGLTHRLPGAKIFMDLDSIPPGADFEQHIRREIEVCDLVLVMIGDNWLDTRPGSDVRRIDEVDDFVRLEIASALQSPRVQIVPVLVEGALMPRALDLPEEIRDLARINAIELSDKRWTSDLQRLSSLLLEFRREQGAKAQEDYTPRDQAGTVATYQPPSPPAVPSALPSYVAAPSQPAGWAGWLVAAVPVLTFGLGSFAPSLRAAILRPDNAAFRAKMLASGAALEVGSLLGFLMIGLSGEDSTGSPTGPSSDIGVVLLLLSIVIAVVVGVVYRSPGQALPGTAEELARRQARRQYRELAAKDPGLARSINVGRPDLPRDFSDGGLLDLNSVDLRGLTQSGQVLPDEAQRILTARQQLGRLSSVEEATVYANLSEPTAARLREIAVFL